MSVQLFLSESWESVGQNMGKSERGLTEIPSSSNRAVVVATRERMS